jgi:hypothetical protein
VKERATLVYAAGDGLRQVSLDGTSSKLIFGGAHGVLDVSPDLLTFALTKRGAACSEGGKSSRGSGHSTRGQRGLFLA